jgi:hypothetical protein
MARMATQPTFEEFTPMELHVPPSRPISPKGFPFEARDGEKNGIGTRIIYKRILRFYDISKYTKVYGGSSCRSNESR